MDMPFKDFLKEELKDPEFKQVYEETSAEEDAKLEEVLRANCFDCNRPYGDEYGFPDLIIPYWAWEKISPNGDGSGLLCPSCICMRLHRAGIRCEGAFMSGPIISVSDPVMNTLRRVENIELAIEGRNNRWAGIREMISKE